MDRKKPLLDNPTDPGPIKVPNSKGSWILKAEAFVPGIEIRCRQEGNIIKFSIVDERQT